jgi:hypothetical protein
MNIISVGFYFDVDEHEKVKINPLEFQKKQFIFISPQSQLDYTADLSHKEASKVEVFRIESPRR